MMAIAFPAENVAFVKDYGPYILLISLYLGLLFDGCSSVNLLKAKLIPAVQQ